LRWSNAWMTKMYDFSCEHCAGTVRERRVAREAMRHKGTFIILEDVPVGVCDRCGARYFDASILRRIADIGRGTEGSVRTIEVPVAPYAPV
jgi:YgiT-type zinc finger domain-containing protein